MLDDSGAKPVPGSLYLKIVYEAAIVDSVKDAAQPEVAQRRASLLGAAAAGAAVGGAEEEKFDKIRIAVCSWNVGNAPPPDDLAPWVPKDGFDIIAIGTQECEYKGRNGRNCHADWVHTITNYLGDKWALVKDHNLWGAFFWLWMVSIIPLLFFLFP